MLSLRKAIKSLRNPTTLLITITLASFPIRFHQYATLHRSVKFMEIATGNDSDSANKTMTPHIDNYLVRDVPYLTVDDLRNLGDAYAAAWWMNVERFRSFKMNLVNNEGVVFRAMDPLHTIRMTVDWTDFSVEHLSKWWKVVEYSRYATGHERLVRNLYHYVYHSLQSASLLTVDTKDANNPMTDTLAVLAYAPIKADQPSDRDKTLDVTVLAAQVASLIKIGCGRVAVVFHSPHLPYVVTHVWPALVELLQETSTKTKFLSWIDWWSDYSRRSSERSETDFRHPNTLNATFGWTELALVPINTSVPEMMPIPTVKLLYEALFGDELTAANSSTSWSSEEYAMLLGPRGTGWNYIYYTEPDSPLLTRQESLPQFRTILDQGMALFPHRLTAVAHESDLAKQDEDGTSGGTGSHGNQLSTYDLPSRYYLPAKDNWTNVLELSHSVGCCDGGKHYYPALDDFPNAKGFWFTEGFGETIKNTTNEHRERFRRMVTYSLIRIPHGINITLFQASEHGRLCKVEIGGCPSRIRDAE